MQKKKEGVIHTTLVIVLFSVLSGLLHHLESGSGYPSFTGVLGWVTVQLRSSSLLWELFSIFIIIIIILLIHIDTHASPALPYLPPWMEGSFRKRITILLLYTYLLLFI